MYMYMYQGTEVIVNVLQENNIKYELYPIEKHKLIVNNYTYNINSISHKQSSWILLAFTNMYIKCWYQDVHYQIFTLYWLTHSLSLSLSHTHTHTHKSSAVCLSEYRPMKPLTASTLVTLPLFVNTFSFYPKHTYTQLHWKNTYFME